MSDFDLGDYVPVNARVAQFVEAHPDGRIQTEIVTHTDSLVVVKALIYRDGQDGRPVTAHSQLAIPGRTPFTRGSEVENAETSAVGRALGFMGIGITASIASSDEVRTKRHESEGPQHGTAIRIPPSTTPGSDTPWGALTRAMPASHVLRAQVMQVIGEFTPASLNQYLEQNPETTIERILEEAAAL